MPSSPIEMPLNTLVTMNASPCTVPTRPFAFACRSTGTSSVTSVESARLRSSSTTHPASTTSVNTQNHGPSSASSASAGTRKNMVHPIVNATSEHQADSRITRSLRVRSTSEPNHIEHTASASIYAPPRIPVARMLRVSRYTQNTTANQRKFVTRPATAVLPSAWANVRHPPGGGRRV